MLCGALVYFNLLLFYYCLVYYSHQTFQSLTIYYRHHSTFNSNSLLLILIKDTMIVYTMCCVIMDWIVSVSSVCLTRRS